MKNLVKIILFIVLFIFIWNIVFSILRIQKNSIELFYDEPKNSLDVMYYGSSSTYAFYNAPLAYNEFGFTTGIRASDGQPFNALKYLSMESLKYQNPKVSVFDVDSIAYNATIVNEGDIRKVIDNMKMSKIRMDLTDELLDFYIDSDAEKLSYYLPFLYYHSSWKDLNSDKLYANKLFKGSILSKLSVSVEPQEKQEWVVGDAKLTDNEYKMINDLIKYINDSKINAIFVISKRRFSDEAMQKFNTLTKLANQGNIKVINFNLLDDFDVNYETDFYNRNHLNTSGSIRYTLYLANYLKEHYNLDDHRGDKKYASWDKAFDKYKKRYNKLTKNDYENVLNNIKTEKVEEIYEESNN